MTPTTEWDKIEGEPATIGGLYTGYICILAAIPVVARLIGSLVFGYGAIFVHWRPSLMSAITQALVSYVLSLASIYILALIIDALAPTFDGQKSQIQSFKLAAYSWTAAWLAGIFAIFPPLGILSIVGLYSCYLLYLGLPKLMKAPAEKAVAYTAVSLIIAVVLFIIVGAIAGSVILWTGGYPVASDGHVSGTLNVPGGSIDVGKLDAAAKSIEATNQQMQAQQNGQPAPAGAMKPVSGDALKALLPGSLGGGLARSETSSSTASVAGMAGSEAEATYAQGSDRHINLKVADMGALGALGGVMKVSSDKETSTGYEKVNTIDGRLTEEDYDNANKSGKYSVLVGSRFLVEADGDGVSMDDLKGAVGAVNASVLEGMGKS